MTASTNPKLHTSHAPNLTDLTPNECWTLFTTQYKPFIVTRAVHIVKNSKGRMDVDEAIQELHVELWSAICSPNFQKHREDWMGFLYNSVSWKSIKLIRESHTEKRTHEVLMPYPGSEKNDTTLVDETMEPQVQMRDWIKQASKQIQNLPKRYRIVVDAFFNPKSTISNVQSEGNRGACYEIATITDLTEYTGNSYAAKDLKAALCYLEKTIGNPFGDGPSRWETPPVIVEDKLNDSTFVVPQSLLNSERPEPAPTKKTFQSLSSLV